MKQNLYKGKFFVFEGLSGACKSTQAELLREYFDDRSSPVFLTKEPTEATQAGRAIKEALKKMNGISPLRLQELCAEDRAWHLKEEMVPALRAGKMVISDRYAFASLACGALEVPMRMLLRLNRDFVCPDKVFLLRISPEESWRRICRRGATRNIFEEPEMLRRIADNYDALAASPRFKDIFSVIDGEKSIEDVHREIVLCLNG